LRLLAAAVCRRGVRAEYWADMDAATNLKLQGYDTLRYAASPIRFNAQYIAGQIWQALRDRGMT